MPTIASPARTADPSMTRERSTTPMAVPAISNASAAIRPGMFCRLAAHQRTTGLAATRRDAADELGDLGRVELADGHVVEEGERLRAACRRRRRRTSPRGRSRSCRTGRARGDRRLGPDAVGRGDQQRLPVALRDGERATKAAEPSARQTTSRDPASTRRALASRRPPARRHAMSTPAAAYAALDGRRPLGHGRCRHPTGSSRMNLRLATSYGTGSG